MSEDLMNQCRNLPIADKIELRNYLSSCIANSRSTSKDRDRASVLLRYMERILGREVSIFGRKPDDVWARTMVAYEMLLEGYSTGETGKQLFRDHSTIIHLKRKMEDALSVPMAYRDIIQIWEEFKNTIL